MEISNVQVMYECVYYLVFEKIGVTPQ